jgi:subtilisin family serine protease
MDCNGTGSMTDVVAALEWVLGNAARPALVLMSLGGPAAAVLDDACRSVMAAGIAVVAAAGNGATGTC